MFKGDNTQNYSPIFRIAILAVIVRHICAVYFPL